jgi:hypothetical protein
MSPICGPARGTTRTPIDAPFPEAAPTPRQHEQDATATKRGKTMRHPRPTLEAAPNNQNAGISR